MLYQIMHLCCQHCYHDLFVHMPFNVFNDTCDLLGIRVPLLLVITGLVSISLLGVQVMVVNQCCCSGASESADILQRNGERQTQLLHSL